MKALINKTTTTNREIRLPVLKCSQLETVWKWTDAFIRFLMCRDRKQIYNVVRTINTKLLLAALFAWHLAREFTKPPETLSSSLKWLRGF